MRIPTYRIHNVLQQYTDRLTGGDGERDDRGLVRAKPLDESGFMATVKRLELMGMIADTISEHVAQIGTAVPEGRAGAASSPDTKATAVPAKNGELTPFVYNVIGRDQRKVKRTISVTRFYEP